VGGQELFIDNVEADAAVDMAFALITEADTSFCEADYSRDGDVDGADLATAIADFGRSDCFATGDCEADHNYDGAVEETDLADLAPDFGRSNCPCALP
jgi:hypothetical protein